MIRLPIHLAVLALGASVVLGGCGGDDDASDTTRVTSAPTSRDHGAEGWDPKGLATAQELADGLVDGGLECESYAEYEYVVIAADYEGRLPIPAAMANCVGPGDEDITFEVFAEDKARDDFYATKLYLVCRTAAENNVPIELPYVEGSSWLIEPDEEGTANRIADILDGESKLGTCPETPSTSAPPTTSAT